MSVESMMTASSAGRRGAAARSRHDGVGARPVYGFGASADLREEYLVGTASKVLRFYRGAAEESQVRVLPTIGGGALA